MNISVRKKSIAFLAALFLLLAYATKRPVDLRDKTLRKTGVSTELESAGRAILKKMAIAHGSTYYHNEAQQTFRFTNTWEWLPGAIYRPWRENGQAIEMTCNTGIHLSTETRFLSGENKNEVWGVDQKRAYTRSSPTDNPVFKRDANIELWLSSFQFLFELPFRTDFYPIVADMGMEEIEGQPYHKVFISWFREQPSNSHDQLVFWIHPETYRLEKTHYTCRDSGFGFFTATIHYQDYTRERGFLSPQRADITFGGPKTAFFGKPIGLHHIEMIGDFAYLVLE